MDRPPCIRCGVCCVQCNCGAWGDGTNRKDICKALIFHKEGHTSCRNMLEGKENPFKGGCAIRAVVSPETFEMEKAYAESKAGRKLNGKGRDK